MDSASSYAAGDAAMLDLAGRRVQAEKILVVIEHFAASRQTTRQDWASWRCLDVGCSVGITTHLLGQQGALAVGIDIDQAALRYPPAQPLWRASQAGAHPVAASALAIPSADDTFDLVICNQVYQHVPDVAGLLAEIRRVLKPGGLCFFSARNLWGIAARENRLPWLAATAPWALRLIEPLCVGQGNWRHTTGTLWPYRKLRRLAERCFTVHDYSTRVLTVPTLAQRFLPRMRQPGLAWALRHVLPLARPILPTHLWILKKPIDARRPYVSIHPPN